MTDNRGMEATTHELEEAVERLRIGARDPKAAKESLAILEREREELRKTIGVVEVAVELIRDARDP
jgi:hypothetical protein